MSKSFAKHFAEVFKSALLQFSPDHNYFLHQVWHDCYPDLLQALPPYLQEDTQNNLKESLGKLTFKKDLFTDFISCTEGKWDIIQTSNISDWMPIPEMKEMFYNVKEHLNKGGAVIGRRLNGDHSLENIVGSIFCMDKEYNKILHAEDRSFFYSEVVIGWNQ